VAKASKLGLKRNKSVYKVNIDASAELAYIIGAFLGDGSLYYKNGNYSVILQTTDFDFAETFNKAICIFLKKKCSYKIYFWWKRAMYRVWVSSKVLYNFLRQVKANIKVANPIIEKFPSDFIRGFADAEGSVYYYFTKRNGKEFPTYGINLSNTDYRYLEVVKNALRKHFRIESFIHLESKKGKVKFTPTYNKFFIQKKNCYGLHICRQVDVLKFAKCVGFTIKRKQITLDHIISSIESRGGAHQRGWNQFAVAQTSP
jgi:intein-encoded DNA endonuclease-like protein